MSPALLPRLEAGARQDGDGGVAREPRILERSLAEIEDRGAATLHQPHLGAADAEPAAVDGLPGSGRIVNHYYMFNSEALTRGVRVAVQAEYAPDRSEPSKSQWFFLYTITISNDGAETVQLLTRHWLITDGTGHVEEVRGPGVVGKQPTLKAGESFEYTSGCPLGTPFGVMEGTYQMVTESGERFDARIAPFTLSEPYTVH